METTWEHEATGDHFRRVDPCDNCLSPVFSEFKLNRSFGFALDHRNSFSYAVIFDEIGHRKLDQIASTQFAVDSDIEQRQISKVARKFETRADRPNLFGERTFLARYAPLIPSSALWGDCKKLNSWHDMPSDPPS